MKCPNCQNYLTYLQYRITDVTVIVKDLYICPICDKIYKSGFKEIQW